MKILEYILKYLILPDLEKLIDCNKDHDCPETLPKCNKMYRPRPPSLRKNGYCVFQTCQYCQNKRSCPKLGNACASGSLSGKCNENLNSCEYDRRLEVIADCPDPGRVKTALHWYNNYRYMKIPRLVLTLETLQYADIGLNIQGVP